jgi:hypothetical protein
MDALDTIEKLTGKPEDDDQLRGMVADCNALIDRYNGSLRLGDTAATGGAQAPDMQALYLQIVNYKKKIEKIRMGY